MMKFNIRGQKLEVTDAIRSYIEEKIGRLEKYFENPADITANVLIKVRGKDQVVEVTIPAPKLILRGEESNKDLYASIDLVSDKLERQIRKNKTRMSSKNNKKNVTDFIAEFSVDELELDKNVIVKRKHIEMKPMNEEEAILQMELLGHEFFVYKDSENNNVCILYKRKDGDYGIIETK